MQPIETVSNTQKEMTVELDEKGSGVTINHKITNRGNEEIELAPWALTIMRGGGVCEIPNEPFVPYSAESLLPVRNFTVWSYTDLSDPRWSFEREFIRLQVDLKREEPQKIGVLNKQGYVNYHLSDLTFTKYFNFLENAVYPDMNSNVELYTAGSFVEIESLAPLQKLVKNKTAEHKERWKLVPI